MFRVFTAFSGYDSQCLALKRLQERFPDFKFELVGWSEIEKSAIEAHNILFPEYKDKNYGDISKIDWNDVPDFDMLTYSSPCFVAGTKVVTSDGLKNIEDVTEDEYVATHTGQYRKVLKCMEHEHIGSLYRIELESGNSVICTPNHPFYCVSKNDKKNAIWVEARNLSVDEHLCKLVVDFNTDGMTPVFDNKVIKDIEVYDNQRDIVYNLQVDEYESYIANGICVHNCTDFSIAGHQAGGEEGSGTRSSLLWECENAISIKRPKYLILENVTALVNRKNKDVFFKWISRISKYGYVSFWKILNASWYGIPQNRDRLFLVSVLKENPEDVVSYNFPNPYISGCSISDFLSKEVDKSYYIDSEAVNKWIVENENKIKACISEKNHIDINSIVMDDSCIYEFDTDTEEKSDNDIQMEDKDNCLFGEQEQDCCLVKESKQATKDKKQKRERKKKIRNDVSKYEGCHIVDRIPTPTCTGNVAPTLMASSYEAADYKNFYSVGHFPKLGILEVWERDNIEKKNN